MVNKVGITECCICNIDCNISLICNQCNEGKLCYNCMVSCMERGIIDRCPVCRNTGMWYKLNKREIMRKKKENIFKIFKKNFYEFSIFILRAIFLLSLSFIIGSFISLLINGCIICVSLTYSIILNLSIGGVILIILYCTFLCISLCCIGLLGIGTPNT